MQMGDFLFVEQFFYDTVRLTSTSSPVPGNQECCLAPIPVKTTRLRGIYLRAGGSTISYVHSYQVRNTLLRINYLTCLVSTMASSGFGLYHGMSLVA